MNNRRKIGLIAGTLLFMSILVWFFSKDNSNEINQRKSFVSANWTKKFQLFDKNPFGLYLFNTLLENHIDTAHQIHIAIDRPILDSLSQIANKKLTYIFVGNNFGLESNEFDTILNRVESGSDLFLAYNDLTANIYQKLFIKYDASFDYAERINVFSHSKKFQMINLYQNDTVATNWIAYGDIETFGQFRGLSSFMEMNNFIEISIGKGHIYLNSTPTLFFNYQLIRQEGFDYFQTVLSEIKPNQDVVLLELARLSDNYGNQDADENTGTEGKVDQSYLKLIFENPSLLSALLLSILGVLLFIVFRTKRTRPVVPFLPKKKDMTLAYAETITSIYFAKRNPYGLLNVQKKNFYDTIHKHFFIDIQHRSDDKILESLAEKSNSSLTELKALTAVLETKEAFSVTETYAAEASKKLYEFYRQSGIISENLKDRISTRKLVIRRSLWLPTLLILSGLFAISLGTYYLIHSIGVGVVLWPIGLLFVAFGILRLSIPYIVIDKESIVYFTGMGKKKLFRRDELISSEIKASGAILHFKGNTQIIVHFWDMSRFDKKQFDLLLT